MRFSIDLKVKAITPMELIVLAFDPIHENSAYLKRKVTFKAGHFKKGEAIRSIQVQLPISPKTLVLELYNRKDGSNQGFEIIDLKLSPLKEGKVWATGEHHQFMDFAINFAQRAGYLNPGFYPSKGNAFLIQYLPTIQDQFGNELATPARINRQMPRVQLSQKLFQQFSIPIRVAILSHEACHYFKNTRSESKADYCGMDYYLGYGFPVIEATYATTKVFRKSSGSISKMHLDRIRDNHNYIHKKTQATA